MATNGLRHPAGQRAWQSHLDADVKVIQDMLGRASAVETLDTYADLRPDRFDEVADKVSEARQKRLNARAKSTREANNVGHE